MRATVHQVVFEASYAASTMCCAQVQIQVDYAAELDDVGGTWRRLKCVRTEG